MTPRRRRVLSVLATLVAAVVVFVLLRGKREVLPPARAEEAAAPEAASSRLPSGERAMPAMHQAPAVGVNRLKAEYEAYKASSIYPDWSYPLTHDQEFLIKSNAPV